MEKFIREDMSSEILEEEINKKKENLEINPFPEILNEDEFLKIKEEKKNFLKDYLEERDAHINSLIDSDYIYSAYLDRMKLDEMEKSIIKGEITENYENTIISQNNITLSTLNQQKIETIKNFFKDIDSIDPEYDEELDSGEMFFCYEEDPSGKDVIEYIAGKKAYLASKKLNSSQDIIAMDTGVFVENENQESLHDPNPNIENDIKPSHAWLRKPKTPEEMEQMMKNISGKEVEIVTAVSVLYKILEDSSGFLNNSTDEIKLKIKELTDNEIKEFVNAHFEEGKNITGGIDYVTYGREILKDQEQINDEIIPILKGAPVNIIRKNWATVQIIKRMSQIEIMNDIKNRASN